MQTIGERISCVISHFCKTKAEFARRMEEKPQTISNWVARGAGKNVLDKIMSVFPEINANWLLYGQGDMLLIPNTESNAEETSENKGVFLLENSSGSKIYDLGNGKYRMTVPLVPYCAYARFANEASLEVDNDEWREESFEVPVIAHGKYLAFEIKGDSMDDGSRESFEEGDHVLVRELSPVYWKDELRIRKYPYWVVVFDSSVLIKQIVDQDMTSGIITCHSLNASPQYADFQLSLDEVKKLYYVIQKKPRSVNF